MARIPLGGLTTLNLSTHLDPMFLELYDASFMTALSTATVGAGAGVRQMRVNGGSAAAEGAVFTGLRAGANSFVIGNAGGILGGAETADLLFYSYGSVNQRFYTNGVERVRIDSSGNVGVGGVPSSLGASATNLSINATGIPNIDWRVSNVREAFANVDSGVFGLGTLLAKPVTIYTSSLARLTLSAGGAVTPGADNTQTLGSSSLRWSVVYAGTGSINTSDAREKTKVAALTESELACASALAKEIGVFQFLASRDEKGADGARLHIGSTVQRVMEVMTEHGLEPTRYAFICYDEWEAEDHPAEYREEKRDTGSLDSAGNPITETIKIETKPAYTTPAGNRYGFRMDQLALFIARGQEERLRRIEEKLSAA